MAHILPPFTQESAHEKVKAAQALWNTRDAPTIARAYAPTTIWRNRDHFLSGTAAITAFLVAKFEREHSYRLRKELFAFMDNRIAVQFWYEFVDGEGQWWRCYGLEDWTFEGGGKMRKRMMSGNDVKIKEEERWFREGVEVDSVEIGEEHW